MRSDASLDMFRLLARHAGGFGLYFGDKLVAAACCIRLSEMHRKYGLSHN